MVGTRSSDRCRAVEFIICLNDRSWLLGDGAVLGADSSKVRARSGSGTLIRVLCLGLNPSRSFRVDFVLLKILKGFGLPFFHAVALGSVITGSVELLSDASDLMLLPTGLLVTALSRREPLNDRNISIPTRMEI